MLGGHYELLFYEVTPNPMNGGAIILCGGRSERMGRDKAALPFGPGETMLGRVVRLVCRVVPAERIICVAAPGQAVPDLPDGVAIIHDSRPRGGPLVGLAAGLAAMQHTADAVFAIGGDVPLLAPALVERMFELLGDHQIAAPHDCERWHPLVAVYRTEVLSTAESLLDGGERSLVALLESCRTRRVNVDELRDADPDLASLTPCNTPAEFQAALRRAGFPIPTG